MQRCSRCGREAEGIYLPYMHKYLCNDCFRQFYEKKVKNTIIKHGMLRGVRRLGVAVSGGKDSMALLRVLSELYPDLDLLPIHINLGIGEYSEECERNSKKLCDELGVECIIYRLSEREGFTIPDFLRTKLRKRVCGLCGTVKRYLINKIAYENKVDSIATGHNLDDIVEILFELYLGGRIEDLIRMKPVNLSNHPKSVTRIKPLIELTNKENLHYAIITETPFVTLSCPLLRGSRMQKRKKLIKLIEEEIPGFSHIFYKSHLKRFLPRLERPEDHPTLRECEVCGMPSAGRICSYCKLVSKLRRVEAK